MPSKEFLEEIWGEAKKQLPGWLYASLLQTARPRAGGRSAHRAEEPSVFEKLALGTLRNKDLKSLSDSELSEAWGRLAAWHKSCTRRKRKEEKTHLVKAAVHVWVEGNRRDLGFPEGPLRKEAEGIHGEIVEKVEEKLRAEKVFKTRGPCRAPLAFVGASPTLEEVSRGELFVGKVGEILEKNYLGPLGMSRQDVVLMAACPEAYLDEEGEFREPTQTEILKWKGWAFGELDRMSPQVVVALGKSAKAALGERADFVLPHPQAIKTFGDSGEVARKLRRVSDRLETVEKLEEEKEGGEKEWKNDWQKYFPASGEGEFVYQHHWRGLEEGEEKLSDSALLDTVRSLHGDLRFTGNGTLFGWTVFLGDAKANKDVGGDKCLNLGSDSLRVTPKTLHSEEWLKVGTQKGGQTKAPGEPGSTSETASKFFALDKGKYRVGVVTEHSVEIFLDGGKLKGRYLITYPRLDDGRVWLIQKPETQTPRAESDKLADVISEQRRKGRRFVIWAKPGDKPKTYDTRTGEVTKCEFVTISKADTLKKIVYGVVVDPYGSNGPQEDAHNDWIPPSTAEQMAHEYLLSDRVVGMQHQAKANAQVVESYVVDYPSKVDYLAAMENKPHKVLRRKFGDDVIHSGSWVIAVKLGEKEWRAYETGEINAFSPGGMGIRTPITRDMMPKVTFVDLVEKEG